MEGNNGELSLEQVKELAEKVAAHHESHVVEISYNVSGSHYWTVSVRDGAICESYSLPSFAFRAVEELHHIAAHGVDFTKEGSQL